MNAEQVKRVLGLKELPEEGGFYVEPYRSDLVLPASGPGGCSGQRRLATAIYYLLTADSFSALHRLASDEIWHFYLGDPAEMLLLDAQGGGRVILLGADVGAGLRPQVVAPRGTWQGARVQAGGEFALLGATVFPGFEFADFELGKREELLAAYPAFAEQILSLTR